MTRRRHLAAAVGFAVVLTAGAPCAGELLGAIAGAFPLQARAIIGTGVAAAIAAALVVETFHFVEDGVLTLMFYLAWRPIDDVSMLALPALAGALVGTLDEWFQRFIPSRVGEIRDVLLDSAAAWRENRILETFYEPALDRPTYVSRAGFRWPAGTARRHRAPRPG